MSDQLNLVFPPKAIATAKKFGCGVVYLHEHVKEEDWLDSTWSGHLADMVRFVKEWSIVESEQLIERSRVTAQALKSGLNELVKKHNDHMCNVRGLGLYQGFSFTDAQKKHKFIDIALEKHNTLLMSAGTHSLRLRPHLSVEERDVKKLLYILDDIASDL